LFTGNDTVVTVGYVADNPSMEDLHVANALQRPFLNGRTGNGRRLFRVSLAGMARQMPVSENTQGSGWVVKAWGYMVQPLLMRCPIAHAGTPAFSVAGRLFRRVGKPVGSAGWGCTFAKVLERVSPVAPPATSVLPLASHLLLLLSARVPIRHILPLHGSEPTRRGSSFRSPL
jgi:hypothetical protein